MERKTFVAFAFLIGLSAAVYGQERLAVLDTVLPPGITRSVVIPVTEKIMEEFVRSTAFTVVDRAFIEKTLSEKEFSLSDLVADEEKLAEFGGFLRATYIVVSTVERIETRYFLSAKMIVVKTGVIAAQASADRDGTATVLIDLAEEVGDKLVAAATGKPSLAARTPAPAAPPQASRPAPARAPRGAEPGPIYGFLSLDLGTNGTTQVVQDAMNGPWDQFTRELTSFSEPERPFGFSYGLSYYAPIGSLFYWSAALTLANYEYYDPVYYYLWSDTYAALFGIGVMAPVGGLQLFAGGRVGYLLNVLEFDDGSTIDYGGLPYGVEGGVAWRAFPGGALILRLSWQAATLAASGYYDQKYGELGIMMGAAWTF